MQQRRVGELQPVAGLDELGRRAAARRGRSRRGSPRAAAGRSRASVARPCAREDAVDRRRRPRRGCARGASARRARRPAGARRSRARRRAPRRAARPRSRRRARPRRAPARARAACPRARRARASPARRARSRAARRRSRACARRRPAARPAARAASASAAAAAVDACGRNAHSVFQAAPSRSCSPTRPSSASPAPARTTRASVQRCSERSGLRFCGIVMLPDDAGRRRLGELGDLGALEVVDLVADLRQRAGDEREQRRELGDRGRARSASSHPGRRGPSRSISRRWSSGPASPHADCVPTAPASCPTASRGSACAIRSRWRPISAAHTAALKPNVIGSPGCPCVRPSITVPRCRRRGSSSDALDRARGRAARSPACAASPARSRCR